MELKKNKINIHIYFCFYILKIIISILIKDVFETNN